MADDEVKEVRARANALRDSLPQSVDAAALGVREKAPFQLLCIREALIWRTEELARTACDALGREDLTAAALLSRATVESAALAWKLMEVLNERQKLSPQELNDTLIRMLVGSRVWSDGPQARKPCKFLAASTNFGSSVSAYMLNTPRQLGCAISLSMS